MRKFLVYILFFTLFITSWAQQHPGNPCLPGGILPFCTEDNDFNMASPAITINDGAATSWLNQHNVHTCLYSTPCASWYLFKIAQPGDIVIEIVQRVNVLPNGQPTGDGKDVDFACWGPFEAFDQAEFTQNLCDGTFSLASNTDLGSHHAQNHSNGNTGGYPYDNLVDCSYNPSHEEWCFIHNAQVGQWYLLLVTNFSQQASYYGFTAQTITGAADPNAFNRATTNCNLLNCLGVSNPSPCQGESITLYCTEKRSTLPNNVQYKFIAPNGTVLQNGSDSSYTLIASDTNVNGRYELVLVNTSPERHGFINVNVQVTPAELTASATTICAGDSIRLTTPYVIDYDPDLTNGDGFHRWYLNQTEGTPIGTDTSAIVYPTEDCDYVLWVKNGPTECTNTNSVHITVNPIPDITLSAGKTNLCHNESTQITAECHENVSYSWSNGATTATITAQPAETRTYTVTAQLQEGARCSKKDSIVINVDPEITLTSSVKATHCGQKIGGITMHARGGDGHFWFASTPTIVFNDSIASNITDGTYVVTATDGKACTQSATVEVPSLPGPTPCFIFASTDNVNMVINNCTQGNNNRYSWDFGDGVTSFETNPIHEYMEPGRYSVNMIVTDEYDCTDSLRQDYRINGPVYVPNAFSPNGDGVNDEMMIVGRTIQKTEFLWVIYDRHGSLVFMSTDPEISWDGTLFNAGKEAPSGVYVYRIKYKDVNGNYFERDGNITLIR